MRGRLLVLGFVCAGCSAIPAVGPDYASPPVDQSLAWQNGGAATTAEPELAGWWRSFGDPVLDDLIAAALENNRELLRAESRVRESRAARASARAGFLPSIDAAGSVTRRDPSDNVVSASFSAQSEDLRTTYEAGFDAGWEIDIFGGVRREYEAAAADLEAAEAERFFVVVSLTGEVAREYAGLQGLRKRIRIAEQNLAIQNDTLQIAAARFDAGLSSELDVTQARTQLETTRAAVPALTAEAAAARYRLAILLGETPGAIESRLGAATSPTGPGIVPTMPQLAAVGTPAEMLRRRPDVAQAERALAAANARIGAAVADLFPRFDLAAAFGFASAASNVLFEDPSRTWTVIPGVRWPVFQGGRLRAAVEIQTERERQALFRYEETVLRALAEAETAFAAYREEARRRQALLEAYQASARSLELAQEQYRRGLVDFLRVVDAERTSFESEDALARSDEALVTALISIFKALGGDPIAASSRGPTSVQAP